MLKKIWLFLFIPLILLGKNNIIIKEVSFIIVDEVGFQKENINAPLMDCQNICKEINRWNIQIPIDKIKAWKERNSSLLQKDFKIESTVLNLQNLESTFYKFIETIDKKINQPDFIKTKLMNNRYLIAFYLDNLDTELRVIKSRKDQGFNLISDVNIILKAVIFKSDLKNNKFTFFKVISGESLDLDYMRNVRELYSINYFNSEFQRFPTNHFLGQIKFRNSLEKSFSQTYESIINQFHKINAFRKLSQIQDVQNGYVILPENHKKDLRIDSPISFNVLRIDGSLQELAWGKVDKKSQAKIIKGLNYTNVLDWSYMPYWKGYLFGTSLKYGSATLISNNISIASLSEYMIFADVKMDLGYLLNNALLSEVWLDLSIYSGFETTSIIESKHISNLESNFLYGIQSDITFRKYMKKAFFVDGGLNIGAKFSEYEIGYFNYTAYDNGTLNISSYYLGFQGGGGYSFSQDLELSLGFEYILPIFGSSYIEENGRMLNRDAMDYIDNQNIQYDRLLRFSIGAKISY